MGIRKEKTMTWQEITTEIVSDVAQITSASPETESVIGIIQWQAKILAGLIFQPNIPSLTFQDGHTPQDGHTAVNVVGLSILPDPTTAPEHWRRTDLNAVPKKNGVPTAESAPLMYLVCLRRNAGHGVAFPARFTGGHIQWTGNPDVIDQVISALVKAGIFRANPTGLA